MLGEEPTALPLVLEALERYPTTLSASRCVSDYNYQCYSQGISGGMAEVKELLAIVLADHPETRLARDNVVDTIDFLNLLGSWGPCP